MVFLQSLYYVLSISSRGLFLMMMMMMDLVFAGPTGLTLKLIHRDSPESPLYPGNLTQLERLERDIQQSIDREQHLITLMKSSWVSRNNSTNSKSLDVVRPKVVLDSKTLYMVQIGIGMFRNSAPPPAPPLIPNSYYLVVDTGSDLLWLQCKGGDNDTVTFPQDAPLFEGQFSSTYNPLPVDSSHIVCRKYNHLNEGGFCGYRIRYGDGAGTAGILATEKLTFDAAEGGSEGIDNFVFGCGLRQNEPALGRKPKGQNPIAGIFGLGGGAGSFIRQLGDRAQNKFEYCFKPSYDNTPFDTFLRFGSDTKIVAGGQGVQNTSMFPTRGDTLYYVIMYGISVDGTRVFYPNTNVFTAKSDGTGGCVIDSGTPMTQLSAQVYDPFRNHLIRYLSTTYNISVITPRQSRFELCFERRNGFDKFPNITFHFNEGADFVMEPGGAFGGISKEMFCLNIRGSRLINSFSVLFGSNQQVDYRILYDLGERRISWIKDDCAVTG